MNEKIFPYGIENNKPYKLFCFNHAGGNSGIFSKWNNLDDVEVIAVEMPGRRKRAAEERRTEFYPLRDEFAKEISEVVKEEKIFLYGHSLGGAFAFETALSLEKDYCIDIGAVFIAGRHAPDRNDPTPYRVSEGPERLKDELARTGDTPLELLENDAFMDIFLPMIYDDYRLHEDYDYRGGVIKAPIHALSGSRDNEADISEMRQWERFTGGDFYQKEFEGGHFFAYEDSLDEVKKYISDVINAR